jgi:predicted nucleotide-binding protein
MLKIPKQDAVTKLQKLIDKSGPIFTDSSAHIGWMRTVRAALTHIFGEGASELEEFNSCSANIMMQTSILKSIKDVLDDYWDESEFASSAQEKSKPTETSAEQKRVGGVQDQRTVFVVHGRNLKARDALFRFLRSIGLKPLEWSQAVNATGEPSPYIGKILDVAFSLAQAVIVLMTPDDEARLREPFRTKSDPPYESSLTPQARPNVLFEAGIAMGRSSARTVLVELGEIRPFSDIGGRHVIKLTDSTQKRQELAHRLESAGCPIDLSGIDWHTEGEFAASLGQATMS